MHQREKQSIVKQILNIASNVSEPTPQSINQATRSARLMMSEGISFALIDDIADQYARLCKQVVGHWSRKYSEDYVTKSMNTLLARVLIDIREGNIEKATNYTSEYIDGLEDEFENYSQEQQVYVPLAGILMRVDRLEIGDVTLMNMSDARVEELIKDNEAAIVQMDVPQEAKEKSLAYRGPQIRTHLAGKICAVFHVVAEPDRARELAVEACRPVIDLLRYSIYMIHRKQGGEDGYRIAIGLDGEVVRAFRTITVISSDYIHFGTPSMVIGPLAAFDIEEETVKMMEEIGIFKMAALLRKPNTTKFEQLLLRGIRSFGKSYTHVEKEDKLLSLITCLETFVKTGTDDRISKNVAEAVAFVLSDDPNVRRSLRDTVKESYGKRSKVSHGGPEVLDLDLDNLRGMVGNFVARMIQLKDKFHTHEDLLDWIDERKFG